MVERPIKKSERLAKAATGEETTEVQPSGQRGHRPEKGEKERDGKDRRGKDRRKGKGNNRGEDSKPPVNPALMRGPRPPKAQETVEEPIEEVSVHAPEELAVDESVEPIAEEMTETPSEPTPVSAET